MPLTTDRRLQALLRSAGLRHQRFQDLRLAHARSGRHDREVIWHDWGQMHMSHHPAREPQCRYQRLVGLSA